jgi:hypothetical protein
MRDFASKRVFRLHREASRTAPINRQGKTARSTLLMTTNSQGFLQIGIFG